MTDENTTEVTLAHDLRAPAEAPKALKHTFDCTVCGYRHEETTFFSDPKRPIPQYDRECPECAVAGRMVYLMETREWVRGAEGGPEGGE